MNVDPSAHHGNNGDDTAGNATAWGVALVITGRVVTWLYQFLTFKDRVATKLRAEMLGIIEDLRSEVADLRAANQVLTATNLRQQGEIDLLRAEARDDKVMRHQIRNELQQVTSERDELRLKLGGGK